MKRSFLTLMLFSLSYSLYAQEEINVLGNNEYYSYTYDSYGNMLSKIYVKKTGGIISSFLDENTNVKEDKDMGITITYSPSFSRLSVAFLSESEGTIHLYDTSGKKYQYMKVRPNERKVSLNTERLRPGVFLINLKVNGKERTFKFVKE